MPLSSIADIRKDYMLQALLESDAAANPFEQFSRWWQQAMESEIEEINAMTLCTVDDLGHPRGRIVLLKGFDESGFVFFTNYHSHKGQQLSANPFATLVFFWKELERQVRISGRVEKIPESDSDAYFNSRPPESRLGAWASAQSSTIASRATIESEFSRLQAQYPEGNISRPPHWGGYCVIPSEIEFWQGRSGRLHDRLLYEPGSKGWNISRLSP